VEPCAAGVGSAGIVGQVGITGEVVLFGLRAVGEQSGGHAQGSVHVLIRAGGAAQGQQGAQEQKQGLFVFHGGASGIIKLGGNSLRQNGEKVKPLAIFPLRSIIEALTAVEKRNKA
jgi:hypothetical protein